MSSSRKKVIVRRFTGDTLPGYLTSAGIVREPGLLDLLDLDGRVVTLGLGEVKMVSYVREFNLGDREKPERLLRRSFLSRPRGEGLWVRLTFRTGDVLEGLAAADLTLFDAIEKDRGLHLIPPDTRSNTQHIYVPRTAMSELQVVGVIARTQKKGAATATRAEGSLQEELFVPEDATAAADAAD